jgi:lipopolysaccharide biosynthesis glycosyltransferase
MTPPIEQLNIVTAANDDYILPLAVMMHSVSQSLSDAHANFNILTAGLSSESLCRLEQTLGGLEVNFTEIRVDPSRLEGLKVTGHISVETYFRLLAPEYLPDLDRVLYLDVDIVVRHSVLELYREQFDGMHLLAVPHASKRSGFFSSERGVPSYAALGIPGDRRTFNAGVMLLNLVAWRRTNTTESIVQYLRAFRETVLWWDQDGLNAVLYDKWLPLNAKWNVMTSHFADFRTAADSLLDEATFEAIRQDPAIIHYSSVPKPWSGSYRGPFQKQWEEAVVHVSPHFMA